MGLDIYLNWKQQTPEEREAAALNQLPSGETTYLRSAYNDAGFDKWSRQQLKGRDFHWYFDLDENKCVEATFDDGTTQLGLFPDWNACRNRVTEALNYARLIPDTIYSQSLTTLLGDVSELASEDDVLKRYRETMTERREALAELQKLHDGPIDKISKGFKQRHAYFFEQDPPKIKAVMLCRAHTWPSVVLICEGPPDIHRPYLNILEDTLRFIDCGQQHNGWITWSG